MGCKALKTRSRRKNATALHDPQNAERRSIGKTVMHRAAHRSVMKKAHPGKGHNHTVCVACAYDVVVADRTAGFGYDGSSAFMRALDVVAERKKRIASDGDTGIFRNPYALFFFRKNGRFRFKYFLPRTVREYVGRFASDIYVDRVIAFSSLYVVAEFKGERLG